LFTYLRVGVRMHASCQSFFLAETERERDGRTDGRTDRHTDGQTDRQRRRQQYVT